ncbi:MAG: bifunctional phosphoribosylaminoimidazolecarboxamide formyltransferase/IMP cyclohydrolase [Alphaproteobacteria bacterium]|nr:bifunctional phosphoribosylaminoimidazolecarboxamide formyltransferase/IMP cyclohydrolase [Alphaproteobacteria bacterium]
MHPDLVPIRRALISVSDKNHLVEFAQKLIEKNINLISTGGSAALLKNNNIHVTEVSEYTNFPEILDGRVKTLHPKIYGGILNKRHDEAHQKQVLNHHIDMIDLVIVNLYPFIETVQKQSDDETCIENIDIGGPSLIRAAAKNHAYVTIITDPNDYQLILDELNKNDNRISLALRQKLAYKAFQYTSYYDQEIAKWFNQKIHTQRTNQAIEWPEELILTGHLQQKLRYGENPHQKGALYSFDHKTKPAIQLQGKELSYNNLVDFDAAYNLIKEFKKPAVAFIKHNNPCGVGCDDNLEQAFDKALSCDPISAFGGIVIFNQPITEFLAQQLIKSFFEVIIAPNISEECQKILAQKPNLRVLIPQILQSNLANQLDIKRIHNSYLVQTIDNQEIIPDHLITKTKIVPTPDQITQLLFALKVCKHVKSNAIVIAKNEATIGIGAGQMSRVDSVQLAITKANQNISTSNNKQTLNAVLASDAFFPFADNIKLAAAAGIKAIIQPGGSIRDQEIIDEANHHEIAMVFCQDRHFKH